MDMFFQTLDGYFMKATTYHPNDMPIESYDMCVIHSEDEVH